MSNDPTPAVSADEALQHLVDGNRRFLSGAARFPTMQKEILAGLVEGQQPWATILSCSDSRVPPELIFDAGFGELFVVRVAGNVLAPEVAASLQYAGRHLHTPLFVVLGHTSCGAVQAALDTRLHGAGHSARIQLLVDHILPGLPEFDTHLHAGGPARAGRRSQRPLDHAQILESPEGRERQAEGRVKLAGAVYEIETGRVRLLT